MNSFQQRLLTFLRGRYGFDLFSRFLFWAGLPLVLLSMFLRTIGLPVSSAFLWFASLALYAYGVFRVLSKNISRRQAENLRYLRYKSTLTEFFTVRLERFRQRGRYRYFRCPSCRATLRVPRGKGKIQVTCRSCGHKFHEKT